MWSDRPVLCLVCFGTSAFYLACSLADLGPHYNIGWFRRKDNSLKHYYVIPKLRDQTKQTHWVSHGVL